MKVAALINIKPDCCDEAFAAPVASDGERGEGTRAVQVYCRIFPEDDLNGNNFMKTILMEIILMKIILMVIV